MHLGRTRYIKEVPSPLFSSEKGYIDCVNEITFLCAGARSYVLHSDFSDYVRANLLPSLYNILRHLKNIQLVYRKRSTAFLEHLPDRTKGDLLFFVDKIYEVYEVSTKLEEIIDLVESAIIREEQLKVRSHCYLCRR